MNKRKNTPPPNPNAFPLVVPGGSLHYGMNLRDWFAGMALQGAIASDDGDTSAAGLARFAFACADKMLEERFKNVESIDPDEEPAFDEESVPAPQVLVYASCAKKWIPEAETEFVNIEEGLTGEDLLTFTCPICKGRHISQRISKK